MIPERAGAGWVEGYKTMASREEKGSLSTYGSLDTQTATIKTWSDVQSGTPPRAVDNWGGQSPRSPSTPLRVALVPSWTSIPSDEGASYHTPRACNMPHKYTPSLLLLFVCSSLTQQLSIVPLVCCPMVCLLCSYLSVPFRSLLLNLCSLSARILTACY